MQFEKTRKKAVLVCPCCIFQENLEPIPSSIFLSRLSCAAVAALQNMKRNPASVPTVRTTRACEGKQV